MKQIVLLLVFAQFYRFSLAQPEQFDQVMHWNTYKPQLIHAISQRDILSNNPMTLAFMYYDPGLLSTETDLNYKVPERKASDILYLIQNHDGNSLSVQVVKDPKLDFEFNNAWIKLRDHTRQSWVDYLENTKLTNGDIGIVFTLGIEQFHEKIVPNGKFTVEHDENGILVTKDNEQFLFILEINEEQQFPMFSDYQPKFFEVFQEYHENWDTRKAVYNVLKGDTKSIVEQGQGNLFVINYHLPKNKHFSIQVVHSVDQKPHPIGNIKAQIKTFQRVNTDQFLRQYYGFDKIENLKQFQCALSSYAGVNAGLQYSYGNLDCVQQSPNCEQFKGMLSHTPSRFGFPRPFLWDEGFHNMVVLYSTPWIALQSLTDWVNTISEDGWIPREQPRGEELRSYIPGLKEDKRESNPPTFFFNFEFILKNYPHMKEKIGELYPKLKKWYKSWFTTQAIFDNDTFTGFLKWWGPSEDYNLGSGMDDYPRSNGDSVSKANIDAQAWGFFFCQKMLLLAEDFEKENPGFIQELKGKIDLIQKTSEENFYDDSDKLYKDVLINKNTQQVSFSPHRGYVNLIPLALGMINPENTEVINAYAEFMRSEETLWTPYGLRSLEKNDQYFGKESNYWRGPIWIPINYLVLRGMKLYYFDNENIQRLYKELRENIIKTVCDQYFERGYFFEHYNQDLDGLGKGNHPFTGWTATITLIVTEKY